MATKTIRLPKNILVIDYDDSEEDDDLVARRGDAVGTGDDGTFNVLTDLRDNAGTIEYKTRQLVVAGGVITTIGAESGWTST